MVKGDDYLLATILPRPGGVYMCIHKGSVGRKGRPSPDSGAAEAPSEDCIADEPIALSDTEPRSARRLSQEVSEAAPAVALAPPSPYVSAARKPLLGLECALHWYVTVPQIQGHVHVHGIVFSPSFACGEPAQEFTLFVILLDRCNVDVQKLLKD